MSPKETIVKFLPLAIVGLSVLKAVNILGRMSGMPVPNIAPILGIIIYTTINFIKIIICFLYRFL